MLNPDATPMTMKSANSNYFTLYSLTVAAAWNDDLQLTVIGFNSNAIIANSTFTLQVFTVSYLKFTGFSSLDTVQFRTSGGKRNSNVTGMGRHFAMDNICLKFT